MVKYIFIYLVQLKTIKYILHKMNIDSMMFDNDDDVPMIILIVYSKFKVQKIWRKDIYTDEP
jgi:hypothetical protein